MKRLTFFTRDGCHLCEQALATLLRIQQNQPFELAVVDLDRDASPEKRVAYDWEIPVLELDGENVMRNRIDEERLTRLLRGVATRTS
jgi:glutaredoxin